MSAPSGFDDPRDSDAAQLWLGLAGVAGVDPVPEAEPQPVRRPRSASSRARSRPRRGAAPDAAPSDPVALDALLTRASDLPRPARSAGGVRPLPWTTAEEEPTRARRHASRRPRPAAVPAQEAEPDAVVGRDAERPGAVAATARQRRRPGPAPLPEEPRAREEAAREVVLRQLAMGPRSRGQLERKLAEREAEPELIAAVLDRFEEVRLVDDAAFAEVWVRSRHRSKGLSRRAIGQELQQKGVDREVAAEALGAIDPEDEHAAALTLVRRRLRGRPAPPRPDTPEHRVERDRAVRRLVGMLGRKGYGPGLAFRVVNEALDEL